MFWFAMGTKQLLFAVFAWERKWKRMPEDTNFHRGNGIACGKFVLFYGGSHFGKHEDSCLPRGVNHLDYCAGIGTAINYTLSSLNT